MQNYGWTERYSVGIKELDEQHQHYFEMVNEIIKMTGQEEISSKDLLAKIDNLNDYAVYHFTTEEKLFKLYDYPDAENHMAAHRAYEDKLDEFMAEAGRETDQKKTVIEVAEFAGSWLANHIMDMDQKYAPFLHEHRVK